MRGASRRRLFLAPRTPHRTPRRGFTLVEVVLVAVALVILLTASLPRFQRTAQRLRAEQAAFAFTQLLRYAHERAVAEGRVTALVWDANTKRAGLEMIQDDGHPLRLSDRWAQSAPLTESLSVRITREDAPVDRISFFPDGTSESTILQVTQNGNLYTLTVDAATSQVVLSARAATR